jgi:hypothetical protein
MRIISIVLVMAGLLMIADAAAMFMYMHGSIKLRQLQFTLYFIFMIHCNLSIIAAPWSEHGVEIHRNNSRRVFRTPLHEFECFMFTIIVYKLQQSRAYELRPQVYKEHATIPPRILKLMIYHCCRYAIIVCMIMFAITLIFHTVVNVKYYATLSIFPLSCIAVINIIYWAAQVYIDEKI